MNNVAPGAVETPINRELMNQPMDLEQAVVTDLKADCAAAGLVWAAMHAAALMELPATT